MATAPAAALHPRPPRRLSTLLPARSPGAAPRSPPRPSTTHLLPPQIESYTQKEFFTSFLSREDAYRLITNSWQAAG
jgi:hypothetical protein